MNNIKNIAYYIINYFHDRGDLITNLKLQKLLYYVQGWHLAFNNAPAFSEDFQAWIHGPVNNDVYQEYKIYKWNPITEQQPVVNLNEDICELTNKVLETYGMDTAIELELRTHRESPWIIARNNMPEDEISTNIITIESMHTYFSGLLSGQS